jgi:2,3-bisphosphoglycerate-independent phosphoglycerate mutase
MGLVSDGGVHSSLEHILALIDMAKANGVEKLRIHAFLDGRDVPPKSAEAYLAPVEEKLLDLDYAQIATVNGRYYAMDRDNRWERVEKAYDNLTMATGARHFLSRDAVLSAYRQDETDEFVTPCVCDLTYEGMADGDAIIFFNFRPDRARQLTRAFIDPDFSGFARKKIVQDLAFVCMTMYDETLTAPIAYPKQPLTHILAQVLSEQGVRQFRTAETEKYAHVTYFFNGGFEEPYPGEDRKLIASPKVPTYDLQPEMSLPGVADEVVHAIESGQYQFIATNFANPDMVGHTGVMGAAVDAVKAVDEGLQKVVTSALENGWVLILTADHGNIETMCDGEGNPHTAHTTNLVPFVVASTTHTFQLDTSRQYSLANVSPTILDIMGIAQPAEMTAQSLLMHQPSPLATSSL